MVTLLSVAIDHPNAYLSVYDRHSAPLAKNLAFNFPYKSNCCVFKFWVRKNKDLDFSEKDKYF